MKDELAIALLKVSIKSNNTLILIFEAFFYVSTPKPIFNIITLVLDFALAPSILNTNNDLFK